MNISDFIHVSIADHVCCHLFVMGIAYLIDPDSYAGLSSLYSW